jgi:hypothetical protein
MDEDDRGSLFLGNYTKDEHHAATVYRSGDGGLTWSRAYCHENNHHIHTVRWDDHAKRLYIAYGDGPSGGQACSDDRGRSWTILAEGAGQGHTDVALTPDWVFWGSDDQGALVWRQDRLSGRSEPLLGSHQCIWFTVAGESRIYVGSMTSTRVAAQRAALLASPDQGATWQKIMETEPASRGFEKGFTAESRNLSAAGWLYFSAEDRSYRVRALPD